MTPSQLDLSRRLAERLRGNWRPGMLHAAVGPNGELEDFTLIVGDDRPAHGRVPVLDDGPTKGALLAMVRRAWKAPYAKVTCISPAFRDSPETWSCDVGPGPTYHAPTEGEALALALLEVL